jgi:hypothetical protein
MSSTMITRYTNCTALCEKSACNSLNDDGNFAADCYGIRALLVAMHVFMGAPKPQCPSLTSNSRRQLHLRHCVRG